MLYIPVSDYSSGATGTSLGQGTCPQILPVVHPDYSTIVIEQSRQLSVRQTPSQIIKEACLDGGSTYEGRKKAVTHLTGAMQKVPIPINPLSNIQKDATTQSNILFKNEQYLSMNESHYTLQKQMQRAAICILQFTNQTTA